VPVWSRTQVTPTSDPMHIGDICNLGIFCVDDTTGLPLLGTNRDLLDFISIDLDQAGMAHIAYTDDNPADRSNGLYAIDVANQTGGDPAFTAPGPDVPEAPAALLLLPAGLAASLLAWRRRSKNPAESPVTT